MTIVLGGIFLIHGIVCLKFAEEVDKFANSKFKDIDKILLSLVDTYDNEIKNEIIISFDTDNSPF